MPYLIDGHNLIGFIRGMSLRDPHDERRLLEFLAPLAHILRRRMVVFFDRGESGSRGGNPPIGQVEARFIPPPGTADSAILGYLRERKDARNYTVVSSDSAVGDRARRLGAKTVRAEAFLRDARSAVARNRKEKPPGDPEEIEDWLRLFGVYQVGPDGLEPSTNSL
jgi:predicted RNA-binding protein with PIN domain